MTVSHVFTCGNPALDFVATLRARRSNRTETLATPDRLDAWYLESGIADELSASTPAEVTRARATREAIYELVHARLSAHDYSAAARELVNRAARKPCAVPQLTSSGRRTAATPDEALSTVAREAIKLLGGPDADLLKECENPKCTSVYLDRSRGMRRQWCSMDPCGNMIKAAAYRARKRVTSDTAQTAA